MTSKIILDKEYEAYALEKTPKIKTRLDKERARIIGKAFKKVMEQLKADLYRVVKTALEKNR
jgi:hypothetical protein